MMLVASVGTYTVPASAGGLLGDLQDAINAINKAVAETGKTSEKAVQDLRKTIPNDTNDWMAENRLDRVDQLIRVDTRRHQM
jgi:hypothetical protein